MPVIDLLIIVLVGYLIGAIPVGAIVARMHNIDINKHGSGKTGTTNVLRTVGRRAAIIVLAGDFIKGSIAVLVARFVSMGLLGANDHLSLFGFSISLLTVASVAAALAAVCGHVWSIYLRLVTGKWQGGRGVTTAMGAVLTVNFWVIVAALVVALPIIAISRYVSLGSIMGAASGALAIVLLVLLGQLDAASLLFIILAIFIIIAHRDNIERLLNGTERKLGERVKI